MKEHLALLPIPKLIEFKDGALSINKISFNRCFHDDLVLSFFNNIWSFPCEKVSDQLEVNTYFEMNEELNREAYTLDIGLEDIRITYSTPHGLFHALITLKHIIRQYGDKLPRLIIKDEPDMEVRGVMFDISRDKIPKMETLYQLIDLLADLKYNHFQLYVEGFSFAYPSFKKLWEGKETPITGDEIKQLDGYCKERFIELVGNQNCFGHMAPWIATEDYQDLAETLDTRTILGFYELPPSTLNPLDDRSIELVNQIFDDILPNFSSEYFNVNLDEPFELGTGKSKAAAEEVGIASIYLDYTKKIYALIKSKNKKMLMWGDIITKHQELTEQLPKDLTVLEWGYEGDHPFENRAKQLSQSGLDFYLCPGTSSWTSITGRTENMLQNIKNACRNGMAYGAKGLLVTDWGDFGHWQNLSVSYPGFVYSASLSWNYESNPNVNLAEYLNTYIFEDKNSLIGDIVLDFGRYNQFEEFPMFNMTLTMSSYVSGLNQEFINNLENRLIEAKDKGELTPAEKFYSNLIEQKKDYQYEEMVAFIEALLEKLDRTDMKCKDKELIISEYKNAAQLILVGSSVRNYSINHAGMDNAEKKMCLMKIEELLDEAIKSFRSIWTIKNRTGGLERSCQLFDSIKKQIEEALSIL